MKAILIDANIFLNFYRADVPNYKKLIESIIEVDDYIFVTQQIVDEVMRNKASVFIQTFRNYIDSCKITNFSIAKQFCSEDIELENWNKNFDNIKKSIKKSNDELFILGENILKEIIESNDHISKELNKLFNRSQEFNPIIYNKAKLRKEVGNPPGKHKDPIGDESTWEQFLDFLKRNDKIDEVYIVSNDNDYFESLNNKEYYINPLLYKELNDIFKKKIDIYAFKSLPDLFRKIHEKDKTLKIATEEQLEKADKEMKTKSMLSYGTIVYPIYDNTKPNECPLCHEVDSLSDGFMKPSVMGGMTLHYYCKNCRQYIDTFDDQDY